MNHRDDPTGRRRRDREEMRRRDGECWRLQQQGLGPRAIGRHLNMAASSVQRCLDRARKLADTPCTGEPGNRVAVAADSELIAEDVADDPRQWCRLSALERYRLRHIADRAPGALPPLPSAP